MKTEFITIGKVIEHTGLFWTDNGEWSPNLNEASIYPTDAFIKGTLSDISNFSCRGDEGMSPMNLTVVPIKRVVDYQLGEF